MPIEAEEHLGTVLRDVERNPLRAKQVARAEEWRWSSRYLREQGEGRASVLHPWPIARPADWKVKRGRDSILFKVKWKSD